MPYLHGLIRTPEQNTVFVMRTTEARLEREAEAAMIQRWIDEDKEVFPDG